MYRVGIGFDVHRFTRNRKLVLGGVHIPCELGLEGHSDADALLHAVCDSILGALGKNDIGSYFPDSDEKYKNIPSTDLLKEIKHILASDQYQIVNIDAVVICERPKISPFISEMKKIISNCLEIGETQIGIKATTTEGLGFTGRMEGVASKSIVLIKHM